MSDNVSADDIAAAASHVAPNLRALVQKYVEHWERQASDPRAFVECARSINAAVDLHLTTLAEQVVNCLFAEEAASRCMRVPHDYDVVAFSTLPCTTDEAPAVIGRMIADPFPYTAWMLRLMAKSVEPYSQWQLRHFVHLVALCKEDHV